MITRRIQCHPLIMETVDERAQIATELWRRNSLRSAVALPKLDVPAEYRQEIALLRDAKFRNLLAPLLFQAYEETPSKPGILGRYLHHERATTRAKLALFEATGVRQPSHHGPSIADRIGGR